MQYRIRDLYWEMRLQTGSRYDKIGFNQKLKGDGMMESYMQMLAKRSKDASRSAAKLGTADKNRGLLAVADELVAEQQLILDANAKDIEAAKKKGVKQSLIDRLELSERRIADMAEGLRQIAALDDPVGEVLSMKTRPNGLRIGQKRVPLGVVGIIYESRPNVTADAFGLCFKTGNSVILRGGSDAIYSNQAIVHAVKDGLRKEKLNQDLIILVEDTDRKVVNEMMKMHGWIDVLIPRGGAGLIQAVVKQATVPVIETGVGNCHVYVDSCLDGDADYEMAVRIIDNAKTQRPSVCNAIEGLLVHEAVAEKLLPMVQKALAVHNVTIYGCEKTRAILGDSVLPATETEYATEFLDYKISVKVVSDLEEAIAHITKYGTKHSECIVTRSLNAAKKFLAKGNKVKITLRFRGREMAHMNSSKHILDDLAEQLSDIAVVEKAPKIEGRSIGMVLAEKR